MWNLQFNSYQDVKNILHWYAYFVSIVLSLLAYFLLIPEPHREVLNTLFGQITAFVPAGTLLVVVFGFLGSFLFVHMFEVHDKVYDRFVIKWRYKYARDFILPMLFKPFLTELDEAFFETATKNMREFMNIFYSFVGDYDVRIRKTAVVRFYDAVWKYWATQINEVLFIMFEIMLIAYAIYYLANDLQIASLVILFIVIIMLIIVNRAISKYFLKYIRVATVEEICEIHNKFMAELQQKAQEISLRFGLGYGNNQNTV